MVGDGRRLAQAVTTGRLSMAAVDASWSASWRHKGIET